MGYQLARFVRNLLQLGDYMPSLKVNGVTIVDSYQGQEFEVITVDLVSAFDKSLFQDPAEVIAQAGDDDNDKERNIRIYRYVKGHSPHQESEPP